MQVCKLINNEGSGNADGYMQVINDVRMRKQIRPYLKRVREPYKKQL